ncbi:MAG: hypothetical protein C0402_12665 [Thermodesulfovibrio sp.]|nr:hypothetical protein [Thermodesulfovibrio sp.]
MRALGEKKTALVSGHRLTYYRTGSGETVLLVHGITTYSFIWRNIVPLLSARYDVITVDLLGCGDSDMPLDVSYAIKDHAERLKEFVSGLGIEKFHFVGHDLGGGMGQIFAVRHPGMLFDLAMINTVAYDYWPVQPIIAMRTPVIRQFMIAAVDLGAFSLIVKRGIYHKERVTDELMDLFMKPLRKSGGRKAFLHFAKCLNNVNLMEIADDLKKLALPVLIIRGDADPYLGATIAERLHREIPGSRLVRIATGGHWIQEDEPEQTAQSLLAFFEERLA